MRLLLVVLVYIASLPASAEEAPKVLQMPTALLQAAANYMAGRPWSEVHEILDGMRSCVLAQNPPKGITPPQGACPGVETPAPPTQ